MPKIVVQAFGDFTETDIPKRKAANPRRKRPKAERMGNRRFGKTGWWRMQSRETGLRRDFPDYQGI
jgi:hypothetical protein